MLGNSKTAEMRVLIVERVKPRRFESLYFRKLIIQESIKSLVNIRLPVASQFAGGRLEHPMGRRMAQRTPAEGRFDDFCGDL